MHYMSLWGCLAYVGRCQHFTVKSFLQELHISNLAKDISWARLLSVWIRRDISETKKYLWKCNRVQWDDNGRFGGSDSAANWGKREQEELLLRLSICEDCVSVNLNKS